MIKMLFAIKHSLHKILTDLVIWTLATPAAFILRYDGDVPQPAYNSLLVVSLLALFIKLMSIFLFRLYLPSWQHISLQDVQLLARAITIVTLVLMAILFLAHPYLKGLPRSVPFIDGLISLATLTGIRFGVRSWYEYRKRLGMDLKEFKRVLIVGAGETGSLIAKGIKAHPETGLKPFGFVDDAPSRSGQRIAGTTVLGTIDKLTNIVDEHKIDVIIIAIPSAKGKLIRKIVRLASIANRQVKYHIAPDVYGMLSEKTPLETIREVKAEDLLRRIPIKLNTDFIADYLRQKNVLITGAGGSIGSELVRQIADFSPEKLILFDCSEDNIYRLEQELSQNNSLPSNCVSIIGDVCNYERLKNVFQRHAPQVVFHAAAYKHLPLMERNPEEAVFNNIIGTKNVVDAALLYGVSNLINISTDKAVNPTSVLGASKYVAECLVQEASLRVGKGQYFVSVRFGNVLGSKGSVIPLFKRQISNGGPVTITHSEIKRFFMTIPEAVQLLLQAGILGDNSVIYILDMGDQVKILDLAKDLISLSGLEPNDVPIEFSGLRPGEKLYEELFNKEEKKILTSHERIFIARRSHVDGEKLSSVVEKLKVAALEAGGATIRSILNEFVEGAQLKDAEFKEFKGTVAA